MERRPGQILERHDLAEDDAVIFIAEYNKLAPIILRENGIRQY